MKWNFIQMDIKPQIEQLEKENDGLRKDKSVLTGTNEDLKKENDHLNDYIEDLKEELRSKEFNEDSIKIAKLEQENREMQLQLSVLHALTIQYATMQEQNMTVMEIYESLQKPSYKKVSLKGHSFIQNRTAAYDLRRI